MCVWVHVCMNGYSGEILPYEHSCIVKREKKVLFLITEVSNG